MGKHGSFSRNAFGDVVLTTKAFNGPLGYDAKHSRVELPGYWRTNSQHDDAMMRKGNWSVQGLNYSVTIDNWTIVFVSMDGGISVSFWHLSIHKENVEDLFFEDDGSGLPVPFFWAVAHLILSIHKHQYESGLTVLPRPYRPWLQQTFPEAFSILENSKGRPLVMIR